MSLKAGLVVGNPYAVLASNRLPYPPKKWPPRTEGPALTQWLSTPHSHDTGPAIFGLHDSVLALGLADLWSWPKPGKNKLVANTVHALRYPGHSPENTSVNLALRDMAQHAKDECLSDALAACPDADSFKALHLTSGTIAATCQGLPPAVPHTSIFAFPVTVDRQKNEPGTLRHPRPQDWLSLEAWLSRQGTLGHEGGAWQCPVKLVPALFDPYPLCALPWSTWQDLASQGELLSATAVSSQLQRLGVVPCPFDEFGPYDAQTRYVLGLTHHKKPASPLLDVNTSESSKRITELLGPVMAALLIEGPRSQWRVVPGSPQSAPIALQDGVRMRACTQLLGMLSRCIEEGVVPVVEVHPLPDGTLVLQLNREAVVWWRSPGNPWIEDLQMLDRLLCMFKTRVWRAA